MSDVTPAEKAAEALDDAIQYIERNQCSHEDTYRAGTIWTICSACGQKWADDEGGFQPAETPQVVVRARAALAALRSPADAQTPVGVEAVSPLDWQPWLDDGSMRAETPFGAYTVEPPDREIGRTDHVWRYCFDEYYDEDERSCDSIEEGMAEAQANWNERIMPILAPLADALARVMGERDEYHRDAEHFSRLAFDDVGKNPPVAWKDRAEAAEKEAAALRALLRETDCPRPCNGRPDDFSAGQCFDAGECGCGVRAALTQGGTDGR